MTQIPAFNPTDPALNSSTPSQFSNMSSEDFIRIMFAELENQDPFQPNDSAALLEQLNTIRSIESDLSMVERLDSLVFENKLASASNLIGKSVVGLTSGLTRVDGTVTTVIREGENVFLQLDNGAFLPVENLEAIVTPA